MLYFCIPVHNEAPTIGVLLWRLRKVFQEFSREYEVLVYDDASTDGTAELLAPYAKVLPLTVIGGRERVGYARSLEELLRAASRRTRYPRRDAIITLQGDFTDQPEHIPELIRRFEGGADVVVAERPLVAAGMPAPVRRLRRAAPWVLKPFAVVPGVRDAFSTFRLYRVSVIRDALRESRIAGPRTDGWAANAALLVRVARHARRIESVTLEPRYEVRMRESRVRPWAEAMAIFHTGRELRSGRGGAPAASLDSAESRPILEAVPADREDAQPERAEAAAADATRERARRSRRGGSRNRARGEAPAGEPRAPKAEQPAATKPAGERAQDKPQQRQQKQPPKEQKQKQPPRAQPQAAQPTQQQAGDAPASVPAPADVQSAVGGEGAAAEGTRPRRRSRGGRSRRRARSGDEGPGAA